ncbi:MAG: tetratricopeptide repeat protein, partial [Thermomonas sp.]
GSSVLGMVLLNRAEFLLAMGEYRDAEVDYRRVFEFKRSTVGDGNMETWAVASMLGRALARQGKLLDAERIQRNALTQLTRIVGPDDYMLVDMHFMLAETLALAHRFDEAADLLERCLTIIAQAHSTSHPDFLEAKKLLDKVRKGKTPLD